MYHLTWFRASSSRSVGSASIRYSPHQDWSSFSGLKRLIRRLTFISDPSRELSQATGQSCLFSMTWLSSLERSALFTAGSELRRDVKNGFVHSKQVARFVPSFS